MKRKRTVADMTVANATRGIVYATGNTKRAEDTAFSSAEKRDWECQKCTHAFSARCNSVANGTGCPYCANKKLCAKEMNCCRCIEKTIAARENAYLERGIVYGRNETPAEETAISSAEKRDWECQKCQHTFSAACHNVATGKGCPYCAKQKLCAKEKNCCRCIGKTIASRKDAYLERGIVYRINNATPAEETAISSTEKRDWECLKCQHTFSARCDDVANRSGCPYCANKKLCAKEKNCCRCIEKTIAARENAYLERGIVYGRNNAHPAEETAISSHEKREWECQKCQHTFSAACKDVANGTGCPSCKHKTERAVLEFLQSIFTNVTHQPKFEWAKNVRKLPFDVLVKGANGGRSVLIEIDGVQHFIDVAYFNSNVGAQVNNDCYKMFQATTNGYSVIRISQEEIYSGKFVFWKDALKEAIDRASKGTCPFVQYLSMDTDLYNTHAYRLLAARNDGVTLSYLDDPISP